MPSFRTYCRVAAIVFFLFAAYPVVVKLIQERLAHDWLHSALHLASAIVAAYCGWIAGSDLPARLFTWAVGIGYGVLGVLGWFIDGLFLQTSLAIPLGPVENTFHLLLTVPAVAIALAQRKPAYG